MDKEFFLAFTGLYMDAFDFKDYRELIRRLIQAKPKKGYGQLSQLAEHAGINPTYVSQILKGTKNLTEDQGYLAANFFGFSEKETLYFLLLIQRERVGSQEVKKLLDKEISERQRDSRKLKNRITAESELRFEDQAVYYADWLYTAIHTLSSIEQFQSVDAIAEHLKLPRAKIIGSTQWLLEKGLCKEQKGKLTIGPATTFVDRDSPLSARHHTNWRLKAIETMSANKERDFFFTAPFSISQKDFDEIRSELVRLIDGVAKRVQKTEPSVMATINVDLFQG